MLRPEEESKIRDTEWCSGLVEGDGCIHGEGPKQYPRLRLQMKDQDVIERACSVLSSRANVRKSHPPSRRNNGYGPTYLVVLSGDEALRELSALSPWLSETKRAQVSSIGGVLLPSKPRSELWMAGWLEAEGCFISKGRTQSSDRIKATSTNFEVISDVAHRLGARNITTCRPATPTRSVSYQFAINGADARKWGQALYPFMGDRRKRSIDAMLKP